MKRKASIVIGLGFGDEGKGLATDYLCCQHPNSLVIRFNGGQQAGHTVVKSDGKRHIFSNFGAGTFRNTPTYWSAFCTFSLSSMLKEYQALIDLKLNPQLLVDQLCPVTTHYDILFNQLLESKRGKARHGSCGMGFGSTIERHDLSPVKFFVQDLMFPEICSLKLKAIREYYRKKAQIQGLFSFNDLDHEAADLYFMNQLTELNKLIQDRSIQLVQAQQIFSNDSPWQYFVFEGAQGLLLDMDFGVFPHMTRSNTSSKNALSLIDSYLKNQLENVDLMYASRAYHTRHGAGPFSSEKIPLELINNEEETNQFNEYQGDFRVSPLDLDLLNYAIQSDSHCSYGLEKNILFTCIDQLPHHIVPYLNKGKLNQVNHAQLPDLIQLECKQTLFSFSNCAEYL